MLRGEAKEPSEREVRRRLVGTYRKQSGEALVEILEAKLRDHLSFFCKAGFNRNTDPVGEARKHWPWYLYCLTFETQDFQPDGCASSGELVNMPFDLVDLQVVAQVSPSIEPGLAELASRSCSGRPFCVCCSRVVVVTVGCAFGCLGHGVWGNREMWFFFYGFPCSSSAVTSPCHPRPDPDDLWRLVTETTIGASIASRAAHGGSIRVGLTSRSQAREHKRLISAQSNIETAAQSISDSVRLSKSRLVIEGQVTMGGLTDSIAARA